jgi:hypothetical protein
MFSSSVKFHKLSGVSMAGRVISCTPRAMGEAEIAREAPAREAPARETRLERSGAARRVLENMVWARSERLSSDAGVMRGMR